MRNITAYFENEVLRKRPYLTIEICRKVIKNPYKKEVQPDGRIRFWGKGGGTRREILESSYTSGWNDNS